jgi:surfactin synthase thioesterase subunit
LRRAGRPAPSALVTVSYPAPDLVTPPRGLHQLPGDSFWREILSYGGVPEKVAAQPDVREVFEPALRADYALLAAYEYVPDTALEVPISVIHGLADPVLGNQDIDGWRRHTTVAFRTLAVPGGHWLLNDGGGELARAIRTAARADVAGGAAPVSR